MLAHSSDRKGLTRLTQLAQRRPGGSQLLEKSLTGRLPTLARAALEVTIQSGDPLGRLLVEQLRSSPDPGVIVGLARYLVETNMAQPVAVWELTEFVLRRALKTSRHGHDLDAEERPRLASMLLLLGDRLADLGRLDDALTTTKEAVDSWRQLVDTRPEAWRPQLARGLSKLGHRLMLTGRWDASVAASREAAVIFRQLVRERPFHFTRSLAGALVNLGQVLGNAAYWQESLEALQEALELFRSLPADETAEDIAICLGNLGQVFFARQEPEKGLEAAAEAVQIWRRVDAEFPNTYRQHLAMGLAGLSTLRHGMADSAGALEALEEAADICESLAAQRPDSFRPQLAGTLLNLGCQFGSMGYYRRAHEVCEKALRSQLPFFLENPEVAGEALFGILLTYQQASEDSGVPVDQDLVDKAHTAISAER